MTETPLHANAAGPAAPPARGPILVTGGSGYIAGALIRRLLDEGWTVHTTLRDAARAAPLRRALAADATRLKVFTADLLHDGGWAAAAAGCSHVAHLASPLPAGVPRHADELIVPARDGVLRVLRAARDAGVQRFVMTSSVAAIAYGRGRPEHGARRYTEADWTPADYPGATPYIRSKTIAERAARDWVAREGGGLVFCSINPSVVLGPVSSADHSASVLIVKRLLEGALPALPDIGFGVVDLRDVADIHLRALQAPGMAGERFIASGPFMTLSEIAAVLRAQLGEAARRVPTRRAPDMLVRLAAIFSPLARAAAAELGAVRELDASHARQVLGWVPRPAQDSIVATARDLLALGLLRR